MAAESLAQLFAGTHLVDLDSMTGLHVPPLSEPIVEGVLRRGHILMLTGPPKAGKSWTMAQLAYGVASGTEWMGFKCRRGRVCYVDTELDGNSLFNRFDKVRAKMELADSGGNIKVMSLRGETVTAELLVNTIMDAYGDDLPDLVVIDSIYSIESGDENSAGDMREMFQQLGRLAACGCAIAFAHHHAKGSAGSRNVIDRGSGSGVFGRFVDAMVDLTPVVPDEDQKGLLDARYGEAVVPMRMSFVLREFADPGSISVVFDFPLLRRIDGDFMDDAPESGSTEAARRKGGESNRRRSDRRWGHIDEAIGRAVNQCTIDGVHPTRANVAERMTMDGKPVELKDVKNWTRGSAGTKWRMRQDEDIGWVLVCIDESWFTNAQETEKPQVRGGAGGLG